MITKQVTPRKDRGEWTHHSWTKCYFPNSEQRNKIRVSLNSTSRAVQRCCHIKREDGAVKSLRRTALAHCHLRIAISFTLQNQNTISMAAFTPPSLRSRHLTVACLSRLNILAMGVGQWEEIHLLTWVTHGVLRLFLSVKILFYYVKIHNTAFVSFLCNKQQAFWILWISYTLIETRMHNILLVNWKEKVRVSYYSYSNISKSYSLIQEKFITLQTIRFINSIKYTRI